MSATLDQVKQKFSTAKHAPRDNCRFCNGTGERVKFPGHACICIYVSHDFCDEASSMLATVAKSVKRDLGLDKP